MSSGKPINGHATKWHPVEAADKRIEMKLVKIVNKAVESRAFSDVNIWETVLNSCRDEHYHDPYKNAERIIAGWMREGTYLAWCARAFEDRARAAEEATKVIDDMSASLRRLFRYSKNRF